LFVHSIDKVLGMAQHPTLSTLLPKYPWQEAGVVSVGGASARA